MLVLFQHPLQLGGDLADRAVAALVAGLVVDPAEPVQVQQRQRQRAAAAAHRVEDARHALQQPGAVGQAG